MTAWRRRPWRTFVADAWPRHRTGVLVHLEVDGVVGLGDAAPMPGFGADDLVAVHRALTAAFADPAWMAATLDADLAGLADLSASIATSSPAAACALETAALDVVARRAKSPIGQLLADFIGSTGGRRVPVNIVVGPGDAHTVPRVAAAWDQGVRGVKLKVGRVDLDREVALAAQLRRGFGDRLELRLDANGAWATDTAPGSMAAFADAAPSLCEQPVAAGRLRELGPTPFPYAADESMGHVDDREALLRAPPANLAAVVLKPMALGGPLACARLAQRAWSVRIPSIVTHMLDSPIGVAVAAELASALPGPGLACGLAAHPGLEPWAVRPPQIGRADAGSAGLPGLGIAIDQVPT